MSKKLINNDPTNVSLVANNLPLAGFKNNRLCFQKEPTSMGPEGDSQLALLMERIEDLKIKYDDGCISTKTSSRKLSKRTIQEVLFDACADVKVMTSQVSMYLKDEMRQKLFNQIDLIHEPEDWDVDDSPVNKPSFNSFLRWFLLVSPERGPGLGLTYAGNIIAAWVENKNRLILEFLPKDKSKWSVTKYIDGEVERSSGEANILRLPEVLSPYEVDNFFNKRD